ncbi:O-antigen ligase family protein [Myxococcota bacterium]|nr:O-antigen ligase family protein [Myxococcota bacterium]
MLGRRAILAGGPTAGAAGTGIGHSALLWRAGFVGAAVLYAAVLGAAVPRGPAMAAALAILPFAVPYFARADRAFWTLVAVWMVGTESVAVVPYVSVFKLLALTVLVAVVYEVATRRRTIEFPRNPTLLVVSWLALNTLASFRGRTPGWSSLVVLTSFIGLGLCVLFPIWFVRQPRHLERLVRLLAWSGLPAAVLALLQAWVGDAFYMLPQSQPGRAHGLSANPNGLGITMALVVPLQLHLAMMATTRSRRYGWVLAIGASVLALIYSLSRSAFGGVVIAASMMLLLPFRPKRVVAGIAALAVGWLLFSDHVSEFAGTRYDVEELEDDPRNQAFADAIRFFSQHPVLGIGLGQFQAQGSQGIPVHNALVSVFVEAGILAGLLFAAAMAGTAWRLYARWRRAAPGPERRVVFTLLATWIGLFLATNFHGGTEKSNLLWFFVGLGYAVSRMPEAGDPAPAPKGAT